MFRDNWKRNLVWFISHLLYFHQHAVAGFFFKHIKTGKCINDTARLQSQHSTWGSVSFLELTNNCLDPAAQFRFRDNGAMLNLKRQGCLAIYKKHELPEMFYVYVPNTPGTIEKSACADHRIIKQTSWGGLRGFYNSAARCADPKANIETSRSCGDGENKRFNFGSVTCYGKTTENVACPKDQFMVVKTASYRGLSHSKTCGLSDDYSCTVDVTCLVKKQCDGQHECKITVDETLFSSGLCPGLNKYLYFEYQCIDTVSSFTKPCVESVSLTSSTSPNKGFLTITIDNKDEIVCSEALKSRAKDIVCRQLGYSKTLKETSAVSTKSNEDLFQGSIDCNGRETALSQCQTTRSSANDCKEQSYVTCAVCENPLLEYKDYFPDSSFTASGSLSGHNPAKARISSGSSWCAPVANGKHYLQVDLGRLYVVYYVATFGDRTNSKWVTSYHLNYSVDMTQWKQASTTGKKIFRGNRNANNHVVRQSVDGDIELKALRFIPLNSMVQPCMRVQICGKSIKPGRPYNLTVNKITSRNAEVSWLDPVVSSKSPVTSFWIIVKHGVAPVINEVIRFSGENKYSLRDLTPFTNYEVSVALSNSKGYGDRVKIAFRTGEDVPDGPPLNVKVTAESSPSLFVKWDPPVEEKRNGVIVNYIVCISHEETKPCFKEHTTEKMMLVIDSLNASTKYYVRVLASTKVGRGEYSVSEGVFTNGKPPGKGKNITSSTIEFSLQVPKQNFTHFYVVALKSSEGEELKSSSSFKKLWTYAAAKKSTDPKPYIAAVFTSSETPKTKFTLGDGKNTSAPTSRSRRSTAASYHNGPLEPGTSYRIFQRILLKGGYNYSTDWSSALKTYLPIEAKGSSDESSTGMIVGVVIALLLLLVVCTLLAVVLYRRRKSSNTQSGDKNNELLPEEQISSKYNTVTVFEIHDNQTQDDEPNDYPLQNNSHQDENVNTTDLPKKEESLYGNQETIIARSHFPIPVSEFDGYVSRMKRNDKKEFKLDFEDLPTGQKLNWSIAKLSFNIPKNRFGNAVTYNDSRVVLSGNEKSDYINASHINGIEKKYYIATQGPKPKTVNDFWRMIFEYKCPTIVMLTTLKEMGKVKCEKYWPDESEVYGEIKVTATKSRAFADYITRTFIVEKGEDKLEVKQFHFRSWPDYGVPLYPTQILTFRRDYKSYHETTSGPAVIHCSAGVGRTGVFIAVDKILDDLDKEKKDVIDVFGFVKDMRTRRVNMVQTAEQYVFIHDTILDHIKCGTNEVEATQLMIVIKKLSEINEKGQSGFEQKFQQLNNISPKLEKELCEAALLPENKAKNRNAEISPTESVRVCLKRLEDIENSDYINACHVDGYLGKNYFIATQTPLQRTKSDFWRMVFQHNSSTIVVLNQLRENDKDYPMFWPTERAKPQSFGTITVMLDSFVTNGNIVVRKLLVSPSSNLKDGRIVRLVQYMSWPDHGVPENVNDIVKLLSEVEDAKRAAEKKGPIIVVCSDGAGRSGTYIAISNLVDRVKVVQVIDVFQCIKLIRAKRPQFVETAAQFKLCYEAITSVLESFNEYSNFSG